MRKLGRQKKPRCKKMIMRGFHHHQCQRAAWKDGYCKQHHPKSVAERRKKKEEKFNRIAEVRRKRDERYQLLSKLPKAVRSAWPMVKDKWKKICPDCNGIGECEECWYLTLKKARDID